MLPFAIEFVDIFSIKYAREYSYLINLTHLCRGCKNKNPQTSFNWLSMA